MPKVEFSIPYKDTDADMKRIIKKANPGLLTDI